MPQYVHETDPLFWEIEQSETAVTTREGRIGTPGLWATKSFKSPEKAARAFEKLVKQREKRGFTRTEEVSGIVLARDEALEAALIEDPDDLDSYLVYSDKLQQFGDPRGFLIAIQHQLHTTSHKRGTPEERALRSAQRQLFLNQNDYFIGPLDGYDNDIRLGWHCGFIRHARIGLEHRPDERDDVARYLVENLVTHPSARLLRTLVLGVPGWMTRRTEGVRDYDQWWLEHVAPMGYDGMLRVIRSSVPTLRRLFVGDLSLAWNLKWDQRLHSALSHLGDFRGAWRHFPRLEELVLQGGVLDLGDLALPALQRLELRSSALDRTSFRQILSQPRPALHTLKVWLGVHPTDPVRIEDVEDLLRSEHLENVKHLGIMNATFTDEVVYALVESPILKRLESLDLSLGTMSDDGGQSMVNYRTRFEHLRSLNLTHNYLGWSANPLESLCEEVRVGVQETGPGPPTVLDLNDLLYVLHHGVLSVDDDILTP